VRSGAPTKQVVKDAAGHARTRCVQVNAPDGIRLDRTTRTYADPLVLLPAKGRVHTHASTPTQTILISVRKGGGGVAVS
jgi:hypothetical protein